TTYGPLLNMDKLPGEVYNVNGDFELSMEIKSLAEIKDILVLSESADTDYTAAGKTLYTDKYLKYDAKASKLDVNKKELTFDAKVAIKDRDITWVAFMVIDVNGNYAITNPYWVVEDTNAIDGFSDVPADAWYAPFVLLLAETGIIDGYPDGTFKPDREVTRAEFAKMMCAMWIEDQPEDAPDLTAASAAKVSFPDVKESDWFYAYVMALAEEGIVNGYPDGTFKPNGKITRAEIATVISNYCGDLKVVAKKNFSDVKQGQWFYDSVMNLANAGYIDGMGNGIFAPNDNATRAQASKFVYVALNDGFLLNEVQ
ncbi:MAG: S-layer homology domain-containing protein, partial [Bacillota bacterium]|nr:S-layer homology domain-containing protein [Bacillota bacterium]